MVFDEASGELAFRNDDIPERDRSLGRFRDAAFENFRSSKLAIRDWLVHEIDARNNAFVEARDRDGATALVGKHVEMLRKLRLSLPEGREHAFVEQELAAAREALASLLTQM